MTVWVEKDKESNQYTWILSRLRRGRGKKTAVDSTLFTFNVSKRHSYVIVEAAHHENFFKNMITEVYKAAVALLLVDAGKVKFRKPLVREHFNG